ncbi:MAG: helix-turn-helix domain-containing protein [Lachnospiraceae bacterium]
MTSNQAVCMRITDLCREQGITYYTLAYRAAIPKSTLLNLFHGTNPTISTVCKICSGFGITMCDFFQADYFLTCEDE